MPEQWLLLHTYIRHISFTIITLLQNFKPSMLHEVSKLLSSFTLPSVHGGAEDRERCASTEEQWPPQASSHHWALEDTHRKNSMDVPSVKTTSFKSLLPGQERGRRTNLPKKKNHIVKASGSFSPLFRKECRWEYAAATRTNYVTYLWRVLFIVEV